jgi:hypothetical protein
VAAVLIEGESPSGFCEFGKSVPADSQAIRIDATEPVRSLTALPLVQRPQEATMKIGPLRTLALCATCAVLAGAGSAALADGNGDGDDGPVTTVAPPGDAGQKKMMFRKCVLEGPAPVESGGTTAAKPAGKPDEKCTVTAGGPPPDGMKPPPGGGCVKVEMGTVDKAEFGALSKAKAAAVAREKAAAAAAAN